jgi:hypothetical protein
LPRSPTRQPPACARCSHPSQRSRELAND